MNYKSKDFDEDTNIFNDYLDQDNQIQIKEQSLIIGNLIEKINKDSSPNDINLILQEINEFGEKCNFTHDIIFAKFVDKDIFVFFFNYIFPDQFADTEIVSQNIELIFKILTLISKSQSFTDSLGIVFINSFLTNYNNYNLNCQSLGIISVSQIISNINDEENLSFLNQQTIDFFISLFPEDFVFHQLLDSLSLLYITITQKVTDLSADFFQQIADMLSNHIKQIQENEEYSEYLKGSIQFFHNYLEFMLIYLQHNPSIKRYMKNFKFFNVCYNYCSDDCKARNYIYEIYTILIEKSKTDLYQSILTSIPSESIISDIEKKPDRRISIFNLYLTVANKESYSGKFVILEQFSNYTRLLETILKIQVEKDGLSFDCLIIIYKLLDIIIQDVINRQTHLSEVSTQIMNIFLKMLNEEDSEFQVQVLNSIDNLCRNICNRNGLDKVKEMLRNCEDFDVLVELSDEHDEAKLILTNIGYYDQDE